MFTRDDFEEAAENRRYVSLFDRYPQAMSALEDVLQDPLAQERLLCASELGHSALSGIASQRLEPIPAFRDALAEGDVFFRQGVGVAVKVVMAKLGWNTTGNKGRVQGSAFFNRAERYSQGQ